MARNISVYTIFQNICVFTSFGLVMFSLISNPFLAQHLHRNFVDRYINIQEASLNWSHICFVSEKAWISGLAVKTILSMIIVFRFKNRLNEDWPQIIICLIHFVLCKVLWPRDMLWLINWDERSHRKCRVNCNVEWWGCGAHLEPQIGFIYKRTLFNIRTIDIVSFQIFIEYLNTRKKNSG